MNLTRFSLFFPEKRDFFLEGQGIFAFGGIGSGNGGSPGDVPVMFFSRQIGLSKGQAVPVARRRPRHRPRGPLQHRRAEHRDRRQGRVGAPATNFTAVRIKRDVLRRSNIGLIATHRSVGINGGGANSLLGADANFFLFDNVTANAFYAKTQTSGRDRRHRELPRHIRFLGQSVRVVRRAPFVGQHFDPQVGYVRRTDFRRSGGEARFTPRPKRRNRVRKYTFLGSMDYVTDARVTEVQNKELRGYFQTEFQNSDQSPFEFLNWYD